MSLTARHVSYTYSRSGRSGQSRSGEFSLRGVSVALEPGSLTGLLGPNGCGKTTLLKVLAGVLAPHEGTVTLEGQPLAGMARRDVARRIAVVPQETHPAFDFTVL